MPILKILVASIVSGVLGRLGGIGAPFNTKYRDLGCPLVTYGCLMFMWQPCGWLGWAMLFVTFGLTFGALTTYWDSVFGFDNHWFHGFMIGLACFPLYWAGLTWWAILIRAVVLAVLMGGWSKLIGWDDLEEFGRYFVMPLTLPLLLLT